MDSTGWRLPECDNENAARPLAYEYPPPNELAILGISVGRHPDFVRGCHVVHWMPMLVWCVGELSSCSVSFRDRACLPQIYGSLALRRTERRLEVLHCSFGFESVTRSGCICNRKVGFTR